MSMKVCIKYCIHKDKGIVKEKYYIGIYIYT